MHLPSFNLDFVLGAFFSSSLILCKMIYDFLSYPSISNIQSIATKPIPCIGDNSTITVWGFSAPGEYEAADKGLMDSSPYVDRVEAYLRLKKQKYSKLASKGLSETPRQKVPFVNIFGIMIDDSSRILSALQNRLKDDDTKLTEKQISEGLMIRSLLTGSLYWVMLHLGFGTEDGRERFRLSMAKAMPRPVLVLLLPMIFRSQNANLQGCGFGKLPHDEIIEIGRQNMRALASILSKRTYILDTAEPTVYDTDTFVFLSHILDGSATSEMEWVKRVNIDYPNLHEYVKRIRAILYPALAKRA